MSLALIKSRNSEGHTESFIEIYGLYIFHRITSKISTELKVNKQIIDVK